MSDSTPQEPVDVSEASADDLLPVKVDVLRVVEFGTGLWVLALALTLVIPSLHGDGRGWWPWACLSGTALGGIGWTYIKRGRGNASAA